MNFQRILILLLQSRLHRRTVKWSMLPLHLRTPVHCVCKNLLNLWHMVNRIRFMSRLEVKNPPQAALKCTAAAKDLAACKPACKYYIIRLWNIKVFAVHLLNGNVKLRRNSLCDRMGRRSDKETLAVPMFPAQSHTRSHQKAHHLGKMCRVERDQPHSLKYMLLYALCHLVRKRFMCHMPPVYEHIRL